MQHDPGLADGLDVSEHADATIVPVDVRNAEDFGFDETDEVPFFKKIEFQGPYVPVDYMKYVSTGCQRFW